MAETRDAPGFLPLVPIGEAMSVKEGFGLESAVVALRKLDARDKATKVLVALTITITININTYCLLLRAV